MQAELRRATVDDRTGTRRRVIVLLLAGPAALLLAFYALSVVVDVAFGDVVFVATLVVFAGWLLTAGSRRTTAGMAASSPVGALFGLDEAYARDLSNGGLREYVTPSMLLVSATVAVGIGWLFLVVMWATG